MIVTLVLVAVLALFTFIGAKKGLVRSVVSLLGSVAAFFLARFIAGWVTPMIAGQVPLPGIGTSLTSALNRAELEERSAATVVRVLTEKGFPEGAATFVADRMDFSSTASIAMQVSSQLDYVITYVLCFAVAMVLSVLCIALVSGVIDGLMKMPFLHAANMLVGAILGFVAGFVIVWLLVLTLAWLAPMLDACFSTDLASFFMQSPIFEFFLHSNPFQIVL